MTLLAAIINITSIFASHAIQQDSLPALHSLADGDVRTVSGSFETGLLTIVLKNDSTLIYPHASWDFEDNYPSTPKRIKDAIRDMEKTFTKLEVPPTFPGGADSLSAYTKQFCKIHAKELRHAGYGEIKISFVVHLKGQRINYSPIGQYSEAQFNLAVKCIQEGPDWIAGMQNGRKVVAYASIMVHLYPE